MTLFPIFPRIMRYLPDPDWSRWIKTLGACLLLILLSQLVWLWVLPQQKGVLRATQPLRSITIRSEWFGAGPQAEEAASASAAGTALAEISGLELRALVAGPHPFALALHDGKAVVLRPGDNAGILVRSIEPDSLTLESGQVLQLRANQPAMATPDVPVAAGTASAPPSANGPAAGSKLTMLPPRSISRSDLLATIGDINLSDWNSWVAEAGPGLRLQKANRLLGELGLQPGDVIDTVNEQPLRQRQDISLLIQAVTNSPQTQLQIRRDGHKYGLLIQGN